MMKGNKLAGDISLTAILSPIVDDDLDASYFKTRLEVGLQYINVEGETCKLLNTMSRGTPEAEAKKENARWHPVRHHYQSFRAKTIHHGKLILRARIYRRDLFKLSRDHVGEYLRGPFEVSFVLSFRDRDDDPETYNSFVRNMANMVESAVVEQEISVVV